MGTKPQGRNVQPVFITGGDPSGSPIPVTGTITVIVTPTPNASAFATGQKNVTAHGTAEQLPSQVVPAPFATSVIAKKSNTKNIYLGASKADAENHAVADILGPGDVRKLNIKNWDLEWIDSDMDGEGVTIISEK